jgi:integrase
VKTPAGVRTVPLPDELPAIFAEHAAFSLANLARFKRTGSCFRLLLSAVQWTPRAPSRTSRLHGRRYGFATGVECRFHDLRHTAYTNHLELGTPDGVIKALLGHISKETEERYSHVRMAAMRTHVKKVRLSGISKSPANESAKVKGKRVSR